MNAIDHDRSFLERYGARALVLGGSEGIGAAFADQLARMGFALTLVARSADTLEATGADLRARHGVVVDCLSMDLTAPDLAERAAELFAEQDYGLVIYNAGATHGVGLFLDNPLDHARNLVRLNCDGPAIFSHLALPSMRQRSRGGVILVSSMSGLVGSGYVAAYAATKSFEIVLAEGLHWELARDGVDVLCAVATLTDTPAMQRSGMVSDSGFPVMTAEAVASGALQHLGKQAVWYSVGDEAVEKMRALPRTELTENASLISARLWGIDPEQVPPESGEVDGVAR